MSETLHKKLIVAAIAFSFFGMAFSGLSGLAKDDMEKADNIQSFSNEMRVAIDESKLKDISNGPRTLGKDSSDLIESLPPGEKTNSLLVDGFEAYAPGAAPPDPPWATTAPLGGTWPVWEDNLEDDVLGSNPDSPPWTTTDAGGAPIYWERDFEDTGIGQDLSTGYADGDAGGFRTFQGDGTYTGQTRPAGVPSGTIDASITPGTMASYFDEGVDSGADTCLVGPAGIGEGLTDHAFLGFWFYADEIADRTDFYALDYNSMAYAFSITLAGGQIYHWPGGAPTAFDTYNANTWYEIFYEYDDTTQEYRIWYDGVNVVGWTAYEEAIVDLNAQYMIGGEAMASGASNIYIDNWRNFNPPTGGSQDIYVVDTYSSSWDGGTQSLFMEQNSEATQAFTEASFGPPYMFGTMMYCWFFVQTETVATSDGAVFYFIDFSGSYIAGFRFNGGNIEYYSAGGWVIAMPYADATEYSFEFEMNDLTQQYNGIWINSGEIVLNAPMGENGAGVSGFRMEGTPGTPSRVWMDYPSASGGDDDCILEVSTDVAHTGFNSLHIQERGATTYASAITTYDDGAGVRYGEFSIWFYADGPMGAGDIYLGDSSGRTLTSISLGSDIGAGAHPGSIQWADNDGVTVWIVPGPSYTTGTWNNISIRYDTVAQSFDAIWNGAVQGTYGCQDLAAEDLYAAYIFGAATEQPQNFYYDDISLWLDDPPAPPTDVNVLDASPSTVDYYTTADNIVEGTVVGTEADTHGGTVQTITEVPGVGGSGSSLALPTADVAIGTPWLTPGNAYAVDSVDTTADADALHHSWYNYDFSGIPAGSTIDGIEVILRNADSNRNGNSVDVALSWDDGGTWTAPVNQALVRNVPTDHTLGGPANDWGHTPWTLAEIQNNMRVSMYYNQVDRIGNVDAIEINVYYTSPPANTLEHRWTTEILPAGATSLMLYVDGGFNTGSDDNFDIGYSAVLGGPYTPIITISTDTLDPYSAAIPAGLATGAPIYLNVVDSNGGDIASADTVTIDEMRVEWTFIPGGADIIVQWTLSTDDGAGANDVAGYNVYGSDAETGGTFLGGPYEFLGTVGAGVTQWTDVGEAADLINNIWYFVTAFDTYTTESVDSGNASKFNVAPVTSSVLANGMLEVLINPGDPVTVTAVVYDDSSTWEDIPKMDEAEWYDNFVGDPGEGLGTPMTIVDGIWDGTTEALTIAIDTAAWGPGESHFIYVRGHEAGPGNTGTGWGAPVGVWVNTSSALSAYDIPIPSLGWVFVSFPFAMSGDIATVLTDAVGTTAWDIAKWYDPTNVTDPWRTYSVNSPGLSDMPMVTNNMGLWLHITVNDGTLTTGIVGDYSAVPVDVTLQPGWNLVGYPSITGENAFDSLLGLGVNWIAEYQAGTPYIVDYSDLTQVDMAEGNAYWIHVDALTIWTVNP